VDAVTHACRWAVALLFLQSYDALTAQLNRAPPQGDAAGRDSPMTALWATGTRQGHEVPRLSGRSSCIAVDVHAAAWYAAGLLAKALLDVFGIFFLDQR
jgi:hypothetical protein